MSQQPPVQRVKVQHGCGCTTFLLVCLAAGLIVNGASWIGEQWDRHPQLVFAAIAGIGWFLVAGVPKIMAWLTEQRS